MKIGGVSVTPSTEILVLPRNEGNLVIKAKAVRIGDEFERLVPEPKAPMVTTKDGPAPDFSDGEYKRAVAARDDRRFAYLILRSIEDSAIEWEKTDLEKPGTWTNWGDELIAAGISEVEINRIVTCVMEANSLDEAKIAQAREDFLRGQGE